MSSGEIVEIFLPLIRILEHKHGMEKIMSRAPPVEMCKSEFSWTPMWIPNTE